MSDAAAGTEGLRRSELSSSFGELAAALQPPGAQFSPEALVRAAEHGVPHADAAGLTVWPHGAQPRTIGLKDSLAHRVDQIQYTAHEGPCLDAAVGDDLVRVDDLAVDQRWPTFSAAVVDRYGIHSMFSVRLQLEPNLRAALNFYARAAHVLTDDDLVAGAIFAAFVALSLEVQSARTEAEQMRIALQNSRQIGTATGILMARGRLTPEQAFEQLRQTSQHLNRKLRDIARDVVETGELPQTAHRPHH